jgi:hypothetical protein
VFAHPENQEFLFVMCAKEDPLIDVSDEFRLPKLAQCQLGKDHLQLPNTQ